LTRRTGRDERCPIKHPETATNWWCSYYREGGSDQRKESTWVDGAPLRGLRGHWAVMELLLEKGARGMGRDETGLLGTKVSDGVRQPNTSARIPDYCLLHLATSIMYLKSSVPHRFNRRTGFHPFFSLTKRQPCVRQGRTAKTCVEPFQRLIPGQFALAFVQTSP
jgi:hypothetical protein